MFRDEIVENMKQLTELKSSDLLSDEEFVGRLEELLVEFRSSRNFPSRAEVIETVPLAPSEPEAVSVLFAISLHGPEGQQRFEFMQRELTIGRSSESDLVLRRNDISRRHARILLRDDRFILLDLKSENGTYLNGNLVGSPQVVHPNDQITVGDYQLFLEPLW